MSIRPHIMKHAIPTRILYLLQDGLLSLLHHIHIAACTCFWYELVQIRSQVLYLSGAGAVEEIVDLLVVELD